MAQESESERVETVVVGGGQAGLAVGYYLARAGEPFVILDGSVRVGDAWRNRWDSLRLFTPARYDALPGMRLAAPGQSFITKDTMADYLGAYADFFQLPIRSGVRVKRLSRQGDCFVLETSSGVVQANQVVVAMSDYQQPRMPEFAGELRPEIRQLHSSEYRNPSQLRAGPVLIVGAGNSGAEIGMDLAGRQDITLSGRDTGHLPFRIGGFLGRHVLAPFVLRFVFHRVLTLSTPMGRRIRPKVVGGAGPLIRLRPSDLAAAAIVRAPRTVGTRDGRPVLADGRVVDVANVVWCTGFHAGFSWIDLPVLDEGGAPRQERGIVRSEPGLYFVGLNFLYAFSSDMVHGVSRDAKRVAGEVARRSAARAGQRPTTPAGEAALDAGGRRDTIASI